MTINSESIQKDYKETGAINPCFCCGKEIEAPKYYINLLESGDIVDNSDDDNSQGLYPIGSVCKNKLPNNFYFTF